MSGDCRRNYCNKLWSSLEVSLTSFCSGCFTPRSILGESRDEQPFSRSSDGACQRPCQHSPAEKISILRPGVSRSYHRLRIRLTLQIGPGSEMQPDDDSFGIIHCRLLTLGFSLVSSNSATPLSSSSILSYSIMISIKPD